MYYGTNLYITKDRIRVYERVTSGNNNEQTEKNRIIYSYKIINAQIREFLHKLQH